MKYINFFENFNSSKDLIILLKKYSIPIEKWGMDSSKTIKHLFNEISEGECRIEEENGSLIRYIDFVGIKIFYKTRDDINLFLVEDRQEFRDGRTRKRSSNFSVAEKMKLGEIPLDSAIRGIKEELGINISKDQLKKGTQLDHEITDSKSYPGLMTKYNEYPFTCCMNDDQFNPDGYVEIQEDKSTFFKWIRM